MLSFIYVILLFNFVLGIKVDIFGPICLFDGLGQLSTSLYNACRLLPDCECNLINNNQLYSSDADFLIYNGDLKFIPDSFKKNNINQKRFCYFFVESTVISEQNVFKLNNYFDYILVPSFWIGDVLKNSGVNKPSFYLPVPLENHDIKDFKKKKFKNANEKIIFGFSSAPWPRKNIQKLIHAFKKAFNNNENVELHVHMRFFHEPDLKFVTDKIIEESTGDSRIKLFTNILNRQEYLEFLNSLDFYVSLSMAEGYGISPREALLLGIPNILTNNTAQSDLINLPGVIAIESNILIDAQSHDRKVYPMFGYQFDCNLHEVIFKLRLVYENFDFYKSQALNINFADVGFSLKNAAEIIQKILRK